MNDELGKVHNCFKDVMLNDTVVVVSSFGSYEPFLFVNKGRWDL